jgi:hypothetical protein
MPRGKKVMSMIIAMPTGMQRTKGNFVPDCLIGRRYRRGRGVPATGKSAHSFNTKGVKRLARVARKRVRLSIPASADAAVD